MNDETGGPAFPFEQHTTSGYLSSDGMTLRDYFAARAMQAWLTGWATAEPSELNAAVMAEIAYKAADAMLEARKK